MSLKVGIVGSRYYNNYREFKDKILEIYKPESIGEIVSGGCRGTDMMAERFGREFGIKIKIFEANWDKYGKSAGPKRNKEIVSYSDFIIAFLAKNSEGTKNTIEACIKTGKKIQSHSYLDDRG